MAKKTEENLVSEKIVQPVEIVEESNEDIKEEKLEENLKNETESSILEDVHSHSTLDYTSRGFKTKKEAEDFIKTEYFKNLGEADKKEFMAWLKN